MGNDKRAASMEIGCTTGTSIDGYLNWIKTELKKKYYGEVTITFKVCDHKVVNVRKDSVDIDQTKIDAAD